MSLQDQNAADMPDYVDEKDTGGPEWFLAAAVLLVAVVGRLPALGSWWALDDWGLLGRAAGLDAGAGFAARWLSQHLWWDLTWPLFGLNTDAHTWCRLLLHGGSAVFVVRIARRTGLTPLARLTAGLLFAATPLAFTPLYWAAGIQELLAAFFALLAVDRWLAGRRRDVLLAFVATLLSMMSKESALGLPLLFTALLWLRIGPRLEDRPFAWAMTMFMLLAAVIEGVLVINHFATDPGDPYATGGLRSVLGNLGVFGWWLVSPGPLLASRFQWPMVIAGGLVFGLWGVWAVHQARRSAWLPALALMGAVFCLGPALPLKGQVHPYLAYLAAACWALVLATGVPKSWSLNATTLLVATLALTGWTYLGMEYRLDQRTAEGLPADPVVRATALSWENCNMLKSLPLEHQTVSIPTVNLLQPVVDAATAEMAAQLGDRWVTGSTLYLALGGTTGPNLVLGDSVRVQWVNALTSNPSQALVLCEAGTRFRHWGATPHATIYAALTDIGLGHFERARRHLLRAGALNEDTVAFAWDPDQMVIPLQRVLDNQEAFIDWTVMSLDHDRSGHEVGGLQDMFFQILGACTGQSVEDLTAGSRLIIRAQQTDPSQPLTLEEK